MIFIALITIIAILLLITAVSMHNRRVERKSQALDNMLFKRVNEEWKE